MSKLTTIITEAAPGAIGSYSQAVAVNGFVFVSGQLGIDPATGDFISDDVQTQAKQALDNLQAVLEAAGSGLDQVIKTTIFLKDMGDFAAVNAVYGSFFEEPFPARACVEVAELPKSGLVEIEAVAVG